MIDKFKYAPGMPGFGGEGFPGENGTPGLSMYFTDYNPNTQAAQINLRIQNNQALWSTLDPPQPLPQGREYVTGDIFYDSEGKAYEIDAENDTFAYTYAGLNTGGYFVPLGASTQNGFERFFNRNAAPKYIIDNVYTQTGAIDYTNIPTTIYGISPVDFTRIEYTNVKPNGGNIYPFTMYSCAQVPGTDDHKALAIVYDETYNTFRIGNRDNSYVLRPLTLSFDVTGLVHTKQLGVSTFNLGTQQGTILTNYEMKCNDLFDPVFNSTPPSFYIDNNSTYMVVHWDLAQFAAGIERGDLYFYDMTAFNGGAVDFTSGVYRPLVFHNVAASGSVRINGINPAKSYACYMKLYKNGWVRQSGTLTASSIYMTVVPSSYTVDSNAGSRGFAVVSAEPWKTEITQNPLGMITNVLCTSTGIDGSINVTYQSNEDIYGRIGRIRVTQINSGQYLDIQINQDGYVEPASFDITAPFITGGFPNYYINVTSDGLLQSEAIINSSGAWTMISKPSWVTHSPTFDLTGGITDVQIGIALNSSEIPRTGNIIYNAAGIDTSIYIEINQEGQTPVVTGAIYFETWNSISGAAQQFDFPVQITYTDNDGEMRVNGIQIATGANPELDFGLIFDNPGGEPENWNIALTTNAAQWIHIAPLTGNGTTPYPGISMLMLGSQQPTSYATVATVGDFGDNNKIYFSRISDLGPLPQ